MSDFKVLLELEAVLKQRLDANSDESYTASLYAKGLVKILDKLGEEAAELMVAAACDQDERVVNEAADTYFHLLVFTAFVGINLDDLLGGVSATDKDGQKGGVADAIAALGSGLGQLIGEISSVAQATIQDNSWASAAVAAKVSGLLSRIGALHSSRGIDFNLVADELTQRMRHK